MSRVATAAVLETIEAWGYDVSGVTDGVELTLPELRSSRGRIRWDHFVRFLSNVRTLLGSDTALEEMGYALFHAPSWALAAQIGRMVVSLRQYFLLSARVGGRAVFSCVDCQVRELGGNRFELTLSLPRHLRPSTEFFRIAVGNLRAWPRVFSLPDAIVEYEIEPTYARYRITLPPSQTIFHRAGRLLRGLVSAPAAYKDMLALLDEMVTRHEAHARVQRDLERLLDSLPDGVTIHRDGIILYANPALGRTLGYDRPEALIGRSAVEFVPESGHIRLFARIARHDVTPREPMEMELTRSDGGKVIASIEPGQDIDVAGKSARLVVVRDLTESRRQEEQLLQAERMASLGALAAGIAHEINNPLAWLHTSLSILEREFANLRRGHVLDEAELTRIGSALEAALDGSERVRSIIRDLRTFSRPDDDSVELLDVREILQGAIRVSAKEIAQHARLVEDYRDVHKVRGSSVRLGQVFLNLMVNAVHAVSMSTDGDNMIRVRTYDVDATVVVEVSDSGPGIPSHLLPRIFEPFFTTKRSEGTGLGLAISHRIVERLGGRLTVESAPGRGTTFCVLLPAAASEHNVVALGAEHAGPERSSDR